MIGIGPILDEIQDLSKDKGYITEWDLSKILIKAKLPRLLITAIYDELSEMGIRVVDKDASDHCSDSDVPPKANDAPKGRKCRLQKRIQKYRSRKEEFLNEDGQKILKEFYTDLSKPRMQYSYFPLVFLAFFDRENIDEMMSMSDMILYFREFYKNREEQGLIVEKKASIFAKGTPTNSEIKRLILFNPLGRSCLIKYFQYDKITDKIYLNESMYNALTEDDVDMITGIATNLLNNYYSKLENGS
jgi:hypothetical protein